MIDIHDHIDDQSLTVIVFFLSSSYILYIIIWMNGNKKKDKTFFFLVRFHSIFISFQRPWTEILTFIYQQSFNIKNQIYTAAIQNILLFFYNHHYQYQFFFAFV